MDSLRCQQIRDIVDTWQAFWAGAEQDEIEYAHRVVAERQMEDQIMNMSEAALLGWDSDISNQEEDNEDYDN